MILRRAAIAFILMLLGASARCASPKKAGPAHPQQDAVVYLNTAPGVGYVGSKSCATCHVDIYREYAQTLMGRSMTLPGELSNLPSKPVIVHSEKLNRYFEIFRQGANLYQSEYELAPDGSEIFSDTHPIAYVMGAGQNGIGYLVQEGSRLFEAPLSYYTRLHSWDLSPGYDVLDYGFLRPAQSDCVVCHSGRAQPITEHANLYKNPPFEQLAVGCENCHGPGELHVEERTKGEPLKGPVDRSIVNPGDLPGWLANNVCMMCHQSGDARVLQPGKTYADFRPGTPLTNTVAILSVPFTRASPPRDPLLQQYAQMVLSKCYRASGGRLGCLTCHNPHFEPTAAEAPAYFRQKCLRCHTELSCKVPLAARRAQSPPDDCVSCHMPRQNLQAISHSALTNHRIIAFQGEPFPEAAFHMTTPALPDLVHVDAIPGKQAVPLKRKVLLQAYSDLSQTHPEYKPRFEALLSRLSKIEPHNLFILSVLGSQAAVSGTPEGLLEAQRKLSAAIAAGSTAASDFEAYAYVLMRLGKTQEAGSVLKRGIKLNPYATHLYKDLAVVLIQLHQYASALEIIKLELKIYPEDSFMRSLVARLEHSPPPFQKQ
ncbi:MAG: tetratricopeptide repeat protein [Terriglobia bacterium]